MLPLRGEYITLLAQIQSIQLRQKVIHSVAKPIIQGDLPPLALSYPPITMKITDKIL